MNNEKDEIVFGAKRGGVTWLYRFESRADYAEAKTIYFWALREAMPELINIGIGKEYRPVQVEEFSGAFSVVGEKQEKAADEKTLMTGALFGQSWR